MSYVRPVEEHPNLHDPVVLRDPAGREYASRVENLGERLVVVAEPHGLPPEETFGSGTEVSVTWADGDGAVMLLPTRILAAHAQGDLQVWSLVVTGPAVTEQRRRAERIETEGAVALRAPDASAGRAVPGSLVDVSEKAIRFSVATGSADRFLRDREVVAEFSLGTTSFVIPGRVEFIRATKHPTQLEELVVVFEEPVADADALRKEIFVLEPRTSPGDEIDRT